MIRDSHNRGFTLIELMISVAIFAVLILALGQAVLVGQKSSKEAQRQANILLGCQQVLEQVQQKTVQQIIAEDGSTFSLRTAGPDAPLEGGGLINVDRDLNGDGTLQTGSLYREGRAEDDLIRVVISFKGDPVIERVMVQRDN